MEPAQRRGNAAGTTTLEGVLERIVFFNEDNGYAVARLQAAGHRDLVTIVGNSWQITCWVFAESQWPSANSCGTS